jgi:hypothetical protein
MADREKAAQHGDAGGPWKTHSGRGDASENRRSGPGRQTQQSWRDVLPVHPAADLFPMMTREELIALGEDIKKNGLTSPITIKVEGGKSLRFGSSWLKNWRCAHDRAAHPTPTPS